jgi:hypothetical protein
MDRTTEVTRKLVSANKDQQQARMVFVAQHGQAATETAPAHPQHEK